jgi:hypothetical protein
MSLWWWLLIGLVVGAGPSLFAQSSVRPWLARQWWRLSFGLVFVVLILPFGIVLIMLLSDGAFDAIREGANLFWSDGFGWVTALTLGGLTGSGIMAFAHRKAPRLQGPPMSERVIALAQEPDKHWQAIKLYEQEAGVDVAVASDVVEAYIASQRRRPPQPGDAERKRLGPVDWMYAGFAAAWYAVLSLGWVLTLRESSNHFITALAFFVFIPGLFGGLCGISGCAVRARLKERLANAFRSGTLTRRFAFGAGVAAGIVSIIGVALAGIGSSVASNFDAGIAIVLGGAAAVLMAAPFLGLWLLSVRAAWRQ